MNGNYIQKQELLKFWSMFGGSKNDGRRYDQAVKLQALIDVSNVKIYYKNKQSPKVYRAKFEEVKRKRHNKLSHKFCFVCLGMADVRHHIIQLQNGGLNSKRNIVSLCYKCHSDIHPWLK